MIASIAAHESWAHTANQTARTAPARAALEQKFLDEAHGDPIAAAHLKKAHMARLALKSAQARRKASLLSQAAEVAESELEQFGGPHDDAA